jgi:fatty acid desaturase
LTLPVLLIGPVGKVDGREIEGFLCMATGQTPLFSLAQARGIVRDLFGPREWVYWVDFLATIVLGHAAFGATRALYDWQVEPLWLRLLLQAVTFAVQCACYFRAVMFLHEVVHLPPRKFWAFRIVWNLLCGIPFLVPAFTYQTHLDHHQRKNFGTEHDGEYLPLARLAPVCLALYLSQCLWVPAVAVLRFGLLTPLGWLSPLLRQWAWRRASSLVMDPRYERPAPPKSELAGIRLQEAACFLFVIGCATVPPLVFGRPLGVLVIHSYLTAVVMILMNSVRTLAAHRYVGDGDVTTLVGQLLDSITLDDDSLLAVLLNPVGLRYHATHHLFPSLPYYNLRTAHRRLMEHLPADSPYRQTVERSLVAVIAGLFQQAAANAGWPGRAAAVQPAAVTESAG